MYLKISFATIKPGHGTVKECLNWCILTLLIIINENKEFAFNIKILKIKKLESIFQNLNQNANLIIKNFKNNFFFENL